MPKAPVVQKVPGPRAAQVLSLSGLGVIVRVPLRVPLNGYYIGFRAYVGFLKGVYTLKGSISKGY